MLTYVIFEKQAALERSEREQVCSASLLRLYSGAIEIHASLERSESVIGVQLGFRVALRPDALVA